MCNMSNKLVGKKMYVDVTCAFPQHVHVSEHKSTRNDFVGDW